MKNYSSSRYWIVVVALILCVICSCTPPAAVPPSNLIAEDKFIEVLTDVRLLEGAYGSRVGRPDTIARYMDTYYKMVFDKHGIVKDQFYSSYEFYLRNHEKMLLMEDRVLEKLTLMQAEIDNRIPLEIKTKKDSVDLKSPSDSLQENKQPSAQSPSKLE